MGNNDLSRSDNTGNLKKGILLIFLANALSLVLSLVSGFFLPKYLSIPSYANLKRFQLYISYIGVLHLGYLDGIYIRYGGKDMRSIDRRDLDGMRSNIFLLQAAISAIAIAVSFIIKDMAMFVFALCLIPENVSTLYKNLYQATGEYSRYSMVLNIKSVITLIVYVLLLFVIKTDNYIWYTLVYLLNMLVIWVYTEIDIKKNLQYGFKPRFAPKELFSDAKLGIVLMLGNFAVTLLTGIDRWFVNFLFEESMFAYYAFAVNVQTMLNTFIVPLSTTLYNYFCRVTDIQKIKELKSMCLAFGIFLISSAFIISFIVETFIAKYVPSLNVLFLLFASQLIYLIVHSIYVNIYKARKQQKRYLKQLIAVLVLGAAYNTVFYLLMHSIEGIAIGTLLSVLTWYIICLISVPEIRFGWKEHAALVLCLAAFLTAGYLLPSLIGFAAYVVFAAIVCLIFIRKSFISAIQAGLNMVFSKFRKKKEVS